jgi:hypothetical protein
MTFLPGNRIIPYNNQESLKSGMHRKRVNSAREIEVPGYAAFNALDTILAYNACARQNSIPV